MSSKPIRRMRPPAAEPKSSGAKLCLARRSEYRERSLEWQRARRERLGATVDLRRARLRLQVIVDEWKQQGCIDCGYDDIRAIDPDHADAGSKDNHVSRLVQLCASAARIRAELAKCAPRCARCHRRKTREQRPSAWRTMHKLPPSWRRRLDHQDRNDAIKLAAGCSDCGWADWARALDWDHVQGDKIASIATLVANGRPWDEITTEMNKCEVVCANCHRLRSWRRRHEVKLTGVVKAEARQRSSGGPA